ncbi:MAG: hypothetical protein LBO02_03185 [Holosporaceae bacterium]|nr:hypothetical protein [Holosporaceae bacterium]
MYNSVISGSRLIQRKAYTFTVESKNSQLRRYIARFVRKTKCYSKSLHMSIAYINVFIFDDLLKTIFNWQSLRF